MNKKKPRNKCLICGKECNHLTGTYCSTKCHKEDEYRTYIWSWLEGHESGMRGESQIAGPIRRYLFEKYDSKCAECGWNKVNKTTGRIPLQVEHIDGDWRNNSEANLTLLCPSCHSLTSTYGSLNKGKGRPKYKGA